MDKLKKILFTVLALTLIATFMVSVTVFSKYLSSSEAESGFQKAVVQCSVIESFNPTIGEKSIVRAANTGNIPEYIRIRMVSWWEDTDGNVVGKPTVDPDLATIYNSTDWIKDPGSNTFYYKYPVLPGEEIPLSKQLLTSSIILQTSTFSGISGIITVKQVVQVMAEAIQSDPVAAVENSWGVTIGPSGYITAP